MQIEYARVRRAGRTWGQAWGVVVLAAAMSACAPAHSPKAAASAPVVNDQLEGEIAGAAAAPSKLTLEDQLEVDLAIRLAERALVDQMRMLGPDHPEVAGTLIDLADLYVVTGQDAMAKRHYKDALSILEKAFGPEAPILIASLKPLAGLYMDERHYEKAEPLYQRALTILEKAFGPERVEVSSPLNSLALLYKETRDYAKAESMHQRVLTILERALGPDHPMVAAALTNLANLYVDSGDLAKAEPPYQRALAIFEKALGPDHPTVAGVLQGLGQLYAKSGSYEKAESLYQRTLAIFERAGGPDHPMVAGALIGLAVLYYGNGAYEKAEPLYERALAISNKTLRHDDLPVIALHGLAVLHIRRGDVAEAVRKSWRVAEIADRNTAVLLLSGSDEKKRAFMSVPSFFANWAVSLHVQHAPDAQDAKRLALTTVLRRKGRALETLAYNLEALRREVAPEDQALLNELGSITAQYSALAGRGPGPMPLDAYRTMLARLDEQRQKIEADISRRGSELAGEIRAFTIKEVEAALPDGAALVELFRYHPFHVGALKSPDHWEEARYVAYVLRRGGDIAWADLGDAAPIEAAVNALLPVLRRPAADPQVPARALDALVMQPIRRLLGETRSVFLSPDGDLNLVPFAALLDEEGHYLIERYSFTYLMSGRDLRRFGFRLARNVTPREPPVILAAPDFSANLGPAAAPAGESQRSDAISLPSFPPLAFTAEEGRAIGARLSGAKLLTGPDATESAVKALHGPQLLHIASHGFFLADQPALHTTPVTGTGAFTRELEPATRPALPVENPLLRSGLVFAGVNRGASGSDDGVLTALEASQLDLTGTKLVVLSACQTGVGEARSGDGVYGLRRALVMAGSETQVMSLWNVNDAATRELMVAYYGKLLEGSGRGEAMRQVQLTMLKDPRWAHPYYWATFIVSGNPATLEGRFVAPDFVKVQPGPRGCGCEVGGASETNPGAWAAVLGSLLVLRRCRARQAIACLMVPERAGARSAAERAGAYGPEGFALG